ncbi:MAG: formyltransferase family protein, partial [Candidatus Omnitrophota bacterium]
MNTYILLFQCRDQQGIVAKISGLIFKYGGNIVTADQYSTDPEGGYFFIRLEFVLRRSSGDGLKKGLAAIAGSLRAKFSLYMKDKPLRMGICVSRPGHCLAEILYLWREKELPVEIPCVISNCRAHAEFVRQYKVPFYFIPAGAGDRKEADLLKILAGKTDFLVLARYMLLLSKKFLNRYAGDIINIHHGFL